MVYESGTCFIDFMLSASLLDFLEVCSLDGFEALNFFSSIYVFANVLLIDRSPVKRSGKWCQVADTVHALWFVLTFYPILESNAPFQILKWGAPDSANGRNPSRGRP